MLNQILSQLGANSKVTVGVAMSPSVGLEMIEINPKTKTIEKYACKQLDYDYSKREIADYDRFREVLIELFDELKIDRKSNVVLTLPSVHYGLISLPTALGDEGVTSAIVSEVEQASYIFKRQDPVVSWVDAYPAGDKDSREILYGAIQQGALDEINAACVEIGCTLVAIETAHNSLLKALDFNNLAEEHMAPNTTWNLMVINQNSYSMITLNGKSVIEYREEPLALRSFVGDEIYEAIMSSAQLTLQTIPSAYLYIVSETDMVSAEVLSMKIPFDGNIKFLESNKYVQNPLMQASYNILPNLALKITPEAIGSGIYLLSQFPFKFNLLGKGHDELASMQEETPKIRVGNTEIELTSAFIKKMSVIALLILLIPAGALFAILNKLNTMNQETLNQINSQLESDKTELANYEDIDKKDTFDSKLEISNVQSINRTKLIYYTAIGANLPANTWLIYLKIFDDKKIDIIGRATNVENVYTFYKNMKMSVIDSDLRLNRLEMSADSVGNLVVEDLNSIKPTFYEFEITNLTDEELNKLNEELNAVERDENGNPKNPDDLNIKRRRGFLFEDFLKIPSLEQDKNNPEQNTNKDNNNNNNNRPQEQQPQAPQNKPPANLPANLESIEQF